MEQQEHKEQEQSAIRLKPIISYPRTAQAGERYLFTIDVQLTEDSPWPYQEEEFEISFILETAPFFTYEPVGEQEPGIVLHRYGATYGAAEYLLSASPKMVAPGKIKVTLLNGWGLSLAHLELECEVKEDVQTAEKRATRKVTVEPALPSSLVPTTLSTQDALLSIYEQQELIAKQLASVGWDLQDADTFLKRVAIARVIVSPSNIALHGYPLAENHYLLTIDHKIVGLIKVSLPKEQETEEIGGSKLTDILPEEPHITGFRVVSALPQQDIPFVYHTTGTATTFINYLEPGIHNRKVYIFHRPSTLNSWLGEARKNPSNLFRARLLHMPILKRGDLFDYQYEALQCIEQSLSDCHPRTLIQMTTGRGKTYTSVHSIYRLLTHANAKHILYVTDTATAMQYVLNSFQAFIIPEDQQLFTHRYQVKLIGDEMLDPSVHVSIGTLEDLYMLYGSGPQGQRLPVPVRNTAPIHSAPLVEDYCADLPIAYFDAIFLAESEHIDYHFWQPVLDYFDAFYIGVASRVSDEVLRFFHHHLVYPLVEATEQTQDKQDPTSSIPRQELVALMTDVRILLGKDSGLFGDTARLTQLVWLLLLKYLDDFELAQEKIMGDDYIPLIEPGYRWRDWVVTESSVQRRKDDELLKFVNSDLIPYLERLSGENVRDIRSIIGVIFRGTYNRIGLGSILREVVAKLDNINFNSSDDTRIIALYYETMLKEIRDSADASGEFYTPRPIVHFIIDRLKPQSGESLLDPACGTGGFLVETYERLAGLMRTAEQRRHLYGYLIGIEKKPRAYLLGIMNMLLHGIEIPNIMQSNALITNIQQLQREDDVDIIATTPPFGGEEEHSTVTNFPLHTSETALLFVQYCMRTLKWPRGRCAMVLPDDFLFGKGVASKIKNRLLTTFNLHTIVRLPVGVFAPYTPIPTNILFFEASECTGNAQDHPCTKEIWYYEISLPGGQRSYTKTKPIQYEAFHDCILWWNQREETEHAWKVPVKELFASDCNLDMKNPHHLSE